MHRLLALAATLLTVAFAANVQAQCAFDAPAKAKGVKADLVRSYSACPGATFASPNSSTMAGVPGCAPPVARSDFQFGEKGACKFRFSTKRKEPCPNGAPGACLVIGLRASCKDVLTPDGTTPIGPEASGVGWALRSLARGTINDESGGDMTVMDAPAEFGFDTAKKGKLNMKLTLLPCSGFDCGFFGGPFHVLPLCTHLEIFSASIADPTGAIFATMGSSTR